MSIQQHSESVCGFINQKSAYTMKFGKNLIEVVDLSNPEWGQYWINYKFLKKKINEIVERSDEKIQSGVSSKPMEIAKNPAEQEFFLQVRKEVRKTSEFFNRCQEEYSIRWERIWDSYGMLQEVTVIHEKNTWTRLLAACVRFYKDVLLLENFAIMNYCGFSKILKKHDKLTGYATREPFMRKVMSQQNFTRYPKVLELIRKSEQLFRNIQAMESVMPLQAEERLFIDAIRDMNYQASRMQAEEKSDDAENEELESRQVVVNAAVKPLALRINSSDVGDRLDEATMLAVDAAKRLNQNNASPNITGALGWIQATKSTKPLVAAVIEQNKQEEEEDVAGSGTDQEAGEDCESNHSRDDNSSVLSISLGKRSAAAQPTAEEMLQDTKRSRST